MTHLSRTHLCNLHVRNSSKSIQAISLNDNNRRELFRLSFIGLNDSFLLVDLSLPGNDLRRNPRMEENMSDGSMAHFSSIEQTFHVDNGIITEGNHTECSIVVVCRR
jgi:hypothetical protein